MANTYKDILITPNRGNTAHPTIEFRGANTSVNTSLTLTILPENNGTLAVQNSSGANIWTIHATAMTVTGNLSLSGAVNTAAVDGSGAGLTYTLPTADNSSIDSTLSAWNKLKKQFQYGIKGGRLFFKDITRTYSLVYTTADAYNGAVLDINGDVHFTPRLAAVGQKVSVSGTVSTYSLVFTSASLDVSSGGVLSSNGEIHFIPGDRAVGQKISTSGVVSTYGLVYTWTTPQYRGGVVAPNGDIHFVPYFANRGQKVAANGTVSTYSLAYTTVGGQIFWGGVLAPTGEIYFVPHSCDVGQKVSTAGTVSTYSLVYTGSSLYAGGVLSASGDIHFVPYSAAVGQKISTAGVVSTYSLVYTLNGGAYVGGVLAPNGDIHFLPFGTEIGQKISATGVVSTYGLVNTATGSTWGGVLAPSGDIYHVPRNASGTTSFARVLVKNSGRPFPKALCLSPWFNKSN